MRRLFFVGIVILCCTIGLIGQSTAGTSAITGIVRDASGAAVPGAKVLISNPQKGITREFTTTDSGLFAAPALVPSPGYTVSVTKPGFGPYEAVDLVLQVGNTLDLQVTLKVGAVAEKVEVVGGAVLVDDTKTEVSQVINEQQIRELPINGRRVDQFALMTPTVTTDGTFGLLTFRGTATGNTFLSDGNDTTNQYYLENAGRTRAQSQISGDAVQEFQVITTDGSAEFGRGNGGIINTVTKSGGNNVHGTAYWFFRNRTLDARDRFAAINPPEVRHQSGFSIGGPIKKDKLFYFGNIEITRRHYPMVDSYVKPGIIDPNTLTWIGCGSPATPAQCQAVNALLPRLFGLVDRSANQELGFAKIDWRPTDRNSLSFSMNYLRFLSPNGIQTGVVSTSGAALGTNGDDSVRSRNGKASWTWVPTGSIVNEARFGWYKDRQADDVDPTLAAGWPIGPIALSVAAVSPLSGYNVLPRINPSEQRFQFADNFSLIKGKHSLKFGIDVAHTEDYSNTLTGRFGSYTYGAACSINGVTVNTLIDCFAVDYTSPAAGVSHYSAYSQTFGNPIVDTNITDLGVFAQDSWKATSKLTVNAGLRYDHAFLPQPTVTNPNYPQTGHIPSSTLSFGPRLGLAYALNEKTVLRGGYGIYFTRYSAGMMNTFFTQNNNYTSTVSFTSATVAGAPKFPNILPPAAGAAGSTIVFPSQDLTLPYSEQWDAAIERSLSKNTSLTVSYVGSRSKHLFTERDANLGPLSSTISTFTIEDANLSAVGTYSTPIYLFANRVDKTLQHVMVVESNAMAWYDALAVQLNKRFSYGFTGQVSYTWSHALDENGFSGSSSGSTIFLSNAFPTGLYNGDVQHDKGNSQLDQRHRLEASFVWAPRVVKNDTGWAKYLLNHWEMSGLLTLSSGRPINENINSTLSTANYGTAAFVNTINGSGGDFRVPFLPVNPLMVDPITKFDVRLTKRLVFTERFQLAMLFEVFNLTNTQYNTGVITTGYTAANLGTAAAPKLVLAPCATLTATTTAATCTSPGPGTGTASAGFPDGTNARRAQVGLRFIF